MAAKDKLQILIQRITALPDDVQAELLQTLIETRAHDLGVYHLDDEERTALVHSGEDMRLGRFASDEATNRGIPN